MANVLKSLDPFYFYIPIYVVGIFAVIRFAIASAFNSSTLGVGLALGFFAMATAGFILLSPFFRLFKQADDKTKSTSFSSHLHSWWAGVLIAGLIGIIGFISPNFSIVIGQPFQIGPLLATATEGLTQIESILATTVMAPLCETFIFVAFALVIMIIFKAFKVKDKLGEGISEALFIALYIGFSALIFYLFHVGLVGSTSFLIAVIIYRGMMATFLFGDKFFNIVPFMSVVLAVEFGYHWMSNVLNSIGIVDWLLIMTTDVFGMVMLGFVGFLIVAETYNIRSRGD